MKASSLLWNMVGKHPSFGDFLRIGRGGSLVQALERWVGQGADRLGRDSLDKGVSWRMAMPQNKTGRVVCGLVKDSRDASGRAHPLLLSVELSLRQSGTDWTAAVLGCQAAWRGAEDLSVRSFESTAQLREALALLPVSLETPKTEAFTSSASRVPDTALFDRDGLAIFSLAEMDAPLHDPALIQSMLRRVTKRMPAAVFIGGSVLDPLLAIVTRPLEVKDFALLWTATSSASEQAWIIGSSV